MKVRHLLIALSLIVPTVATADEKEESGGFDHTVRAPTNALEVTIGTGYTQGGGQIGGGMVDLQDIAGPGAAVEVGVGYRVNPRWFVGAYGTFAGHDNADLPDGTDVYAATAGLQGNLHLRPGRSVDPWVGIGTGWKGMWLDHPALGRTSLQGLELVRVQFGVDYRISPAVAIAPVIGGSVGMFVAEDSPMTDNFDEITNRDAHLTGFVGINGRFDIGASR